MTAENPESHDATGGDDLRARYLPVSRKELRRRREAGLPPLPGSDGEAAVDLAAEQPMAAEPYSEAASPWGFPAAPVPATSTLTPDVPPETESDVPPETESDGTPTTEPEAEAGIASETEPHDAEVEDPLGTDEDGLPEDRAETDADAADADAADVDAADVDAAGVDVIEDAGASPAAEPESLDQESPEDDSADAKAAETEVDEEHTPVEGPADQEEAPLDLPEPPALASRAEPSPERPQDLPTTARDDQDDAPVPASRKSRRGLLSTETMSVFSAEKLAELHELNEAVASVDDPHRVDPELLKKQQALAARAMQANQERLRQEQVEADRDAKMRRRRLRPESEVITRKTLRAHMESDEVPEPSDYATGSIEPVQARGAHGLEIDAMVEHSTRQGARQSMMGWLVIILAVLLVIAIGVVLSFIL